MYNSSPPRQQLPCAPKLVSFFTDQSHLPPPPQQVHRLVTSRNRSSSRKVKFTNFIEFKTYKIVYRKYAGLYFSFVVDTNDNDLCYLESIHLFVEMLDKSFESVCELDLVFGFHKLYAIIDELYLGGEIQETSKFVMMEHLKVLDGLD